MARFLLVAGAFHGAWCWELVTPLLEAKGHRVRAVELPGMGADRTPLASLTFADWARTVADAAAADDEPAIMVGHSRGGVVISQAAELAPGSIRMNVYLAALLLGNGKCGLDQPDMEGRDSYDRAQLHSDDGIAVHAAPELLAACYANAAPELRERAAAHVTPEPVFGLSTPLSLTPQRYGSVPRAYIECIQDRVVPLELQVAMQALEPCGIVRTIDTDHCPNYSAPDLLAETLDEIARVA